MDIMTIEEWDVLLCSTGYLPPRNEEELTFFDELYENYKSRLDGKHVDVDAILNGTCRFVSNSSCNDSINSFDILKDTNSADNKYSMAARNYRKLPKDILDKMRRQHNQDGDYDE